MGEYSKENNKNRFRNSDLFVYKKQKRQILKKSMRVLNRISIKFDSVEAEPYLKRSDPLSILNNLYFVMHLQQLITTEWLLRLWYLESVCSGPCYREHGFSVWSSFQGRFPFPPCPETEAAEWAIKRVLLWQVTQEPALRWTWKTQHQLSLSQGNGMELGQPLLLEHRNKLHFWLLLFKKSYS